MTAIGSVLAHPRLSRLPATGDPVPPAVVDAAGLFGLYASSSRDVVSWRWLHAMVDQKLRELNIVGPGGYVLLALFVCVPHAAFEEGHLLALGSSSAGCGNAMIAFWLRGDRLAGLGVRHGPSRQSFFVVYLPLTRSGLLADARCRWRASLIRRHRPGRVVATNGPARSALRLAVPWAHRPSASCSSAGHMVRGDVVIHSLRSVTRESRRNPRLRLSSDAGRTHGGPG